MRADNRPADSLRPILFVPGYVRHVPGSALCEQGHTRVVATATVEDRVPPFLKRSGRGWITAEYAMLPGAAGNQRIARERGKINNRSGEIQRFVGRALRTVLDMRGLGERTVTLDADVIQADGSTRCASLNASFLALVLSLKHMVYEQWIADFPPFRLIAAVSVGVKDGELLADLDYEEDSRCDSDISIVSSAAGELVEVQSFCEGAPLPQERFAKAIALGVEKNCEIIALLKKTIAAAGVPCDFPAGGSPGISGIPSRS
ncbi:MAG: ribonuclease PH [Acidobacteria bacterium]|jgi:ribonuclease PH|nr:ribonuclease PH [Acidobacteriota bacterium]